MKKLISLLLAFVLAFSLSACGGSQANKRSDKLQRSVYNETTGTYYNAFTGLEVTLPQDWAPVSDEIFVTAFYNDLTVEELAKKDHEYFATLNTVTDMAYANSYGDNRMIVSILNPADYGEGAYDAIDDFIRDLEKLHPISDIKQGPDVILGEYTFKTVEVTSLLKTSCHAYYWRDDGYIISVTIDSDTPISFDYCWAMFNGGPKTADIVNVPLLCEYDKTNYRLINDSTGIAIYAPGWSYYSKQYLAEKYYNSTEAELLAITPEQLAERADFMDMVAYNTEDDRYITVRYINTKDSEFYGLDAEGVRDVYYDTFKKEDSGVINEMEDFTLCDKQFKAFHRSLYGSEKTSHQIFAYAQLNDDYVIEIVYSDNDYKFVPEIAHLFDKNMGVEKVISTSQFDQDTNHFYNADSRIGYTMHEGWFVFDNAELLKQYYPNLTWEEYSQYTEDQRRRMRYIPDFGVANSNTGERVVVHYRKCAAIHNQYGLQPDFIEYCDMLVDELVAKGYELVKKDYGYLRTNNDFANAHLKYFWGDQEMHYYIAVTQATDDYFGVVEIASLPENDELYFWINFDDNSPEFEQQLNSSTTD